MNRKFKFVLLISTVLALMFLAACANDSDKANNEANQTDASDNGEKALQLGETALIESILGDFEVTIESFEIHESFQGEESEYEDHVFMIVNFSVENVGDEVLKGDEISRPTLFTEEGDRSSNLRSEESINYLKEELQPGEKDSGQMLFQTYDSDKFEINFGYGMTLRTDDVIWSFSRSEAK